MTLDELKQLNEYERDELYGLEIARSLIDRRIHEIKQKSKTVKE